MFEITERNKFATDHTNGQSQKEGKNMHIPQNLKYDLSDVFAK